MVANALRNNPPMLNRRLGIERRSFTYSAHIPERRFTPERRKPMESILVLPLPHPVKSMRPPEPFSTLPQFTSRQLHKMLKRNGL